MKLVTFIYPYYENPGFLARQAAWWRDYPGELHKALSVIVVDDGSPRHPAEEILKGLVVPFPLRLFRIDVDVRWNWLAARNIGAHHASGWLLLTDMDHVVTPAVLTALTNGSHDPSKIYRFKRMEHDGTVIHPHPNSWFMTRKMYWKIGGYDEALSGFYGTDGDYRRRCAETADVEFLEQSLIRYEYVGDSSTLDYKRKQPEDAAAKKARPHRGPGWRPKVLSFPFREIVLPPCSTS